MDLEEHTLEELPTRCEECGAPLSDAERAAVLESGGPALCSLHATEVLALDDADEPDV